MRKVKVKCILLQGNNFKIVKGRYDSSKKLIITKKHKYLADESHFFYGKNPLFSTVYVFIDENARQTIGEEEIHGKTIKPRLKRELDAKLMNRLDYLTESSFWEFLNTKRWDIIQLLVSMGCGIGLYSILRVILATYGYYMP